MSQYNSYGQRWGTYHSYGGNIIFRLKINNLVFGSEQRWKAWNESHESERILAFAPMCKHAFVVDVHTVGGLSDLGKLQSFADSSFLFIEVLFKGVTTS